ncbi:MAG: NAD(+) diphosphatase [Clostridia bacterium]
MIQDIKPLQLKNEFTPKQPKNEDLVFLFNKSEVLFVNDNENLKVPTVKLIGENFEDAELIYLLSVDETSIFMMKYQKNITLPEKFQFNPIGTFRTFMPKWTAFAGITAYHLSNWYECNKFCGSCGNLMKHSKTERAMVCDNCKNIVYPKISPVIIVGVLNGDKVMLTKYARGFSRYALIAGFCEIGETLEETVKREVMEEVGVNVKNIRYYKSQPWGFSQSLLMGFFADLDGDDSITLDTNELKVANWINREDIPQDNENELSLTYTMMKAIKDAEKV